MAPKKMRIFAVGAHLDDIEIACGGTIAKAIDKGHAVKMMVLSKSAYTHYNGTVMRRAEDAIEEAKDAAAILGVKELEIFDFPNKDIPHDSSVVELINSRLDQFKPDIIITHWPFDTHKSHQNTGLSAIAAGRYYNSIIMFEPFPPGGRSYVGFRPQLYVNITDYLDKKLRALKAHKSEYIKYGKQNWINAVRARAQFRGFDLICQENHDEVYAEAFEIVRLNIEFLD